VQLLAMQDLCTGMSPLYTGQGCEPQPAEELAACAAISKAL
jgi:hypothetical protein